MNMGVSGSDAAKNPMLQNPSWPIPISKFEFVRELAAPNFVQIHALSVTFRKTST